VISLFKVRMADEAVTAVADVLRSGQIAQGPVVEAFERDLQEALGDSNLLTLNSGTSALHLAYHLIGLDALDTVIVSPMTCFATIAPLVHLGAAIEWADVDPTTGLIDPASVERSALLLETRAIVAIDWAGTRCDYAALRAAAPNIPIVEDAAHAFGSSGDADYVCFSFQAIKHLTCGDGGAIVVPADQLDRARLLRWFGLDRRSKVDFRAGQDIAEAGFKFHMNDLAAAIGRANLPVAIDGVELHRQNARRMWTAIANEIARSGNDRVELPPLATERSSYWFFPILVADRAGFQAFMRERAIETSQVHRRCDEHSCVARFRRSLPGLDRFAARQLALPCGAWLNDLDLEQIVDATLAWMRR